MRKFLRSIYATILVKSSFEFEFGIFVLRLVGCDHFPIAIVDIHRASHAYILIQPNKYLTPAKTIPESSPQDASG